MLCRTLAEIEAAALSEGAGDPPLTQEQASYCFSLYAPHTARMTEAQAPPTAA